jgi:hypothetical protein
MTSELRIRWLRRVLIVKAVVTVVVWGLPVLLAPLWILEILRVPIPTEAIYLRLFGGAVTAWGVAYWFAYRAPLRNAAIVKAGLVDNILPTGVIVFFGLARGMTSAFMWLSGALTGVFFVLFLIFLPRERDNK